MSGPISPDAVLTQGRFIFCHRNSFKSHDVELHYTPPVIQSDYSANDGKYRACFTVRVDDDLDAYWKVWLGELDGGDYLQHKLKEHDKSYDTFPAALDAVLPAICQLWNDELERQNKRNIEQKKRREMAEAAREHLNSIPNVYTMEE